MVVQRGHEEHPTAFPVLLFGVAEPPHLDDHAEVFNEENPAEHRDEKFLADGDGERGDDAAQRQRSGVAHEDLGGKGVVPQEGNARTDKRGDEHHELFRARDVHDAQVVCNDGVGADVCEDGEGHADDGACAGGQTVDAVGEVGSVADRRDNKDHQWDEDDPHVLRGILEEPREQPGVVEVVVLDEGDGGGRRAHRGPCSVVCEFFDGDVRMPHHGRSKDQPHADLSDDLEPSCQPLFVLLEHLDVVVDETDGAEPHRAEDHQLGVDVGEVREQQRWQKNRAEDDEAAHGGGALLVHLAFQAEVSNDFAHLLQLQTLDDALAKQNPHHQRRHQAHARAEGHEAEQAGAWQVVHLAEGGEEVVEHGVKS